MSVNEAPADGEPIVYVIDDDSSVRAALEDLLASVGLKAMLFGWVRAILDGSLADAPSCLVLDIRMPGQSGMDFQREMAGRGIRVPVVFITGHGDIAMSVRAIKAGAIEVLTKPFDNQELLDTIHCGIDEDRRRRSDDRYLGDLKSRVSAFGEGERAVMALVQGLLNKQIAGKLGGQRDYRQSLSGSGDAQNGRSIITRTGADIRRVVCRKPKRRLKLAPRARAGCLTDALVDRCLSESRSRRTHFDGERSDRAPQRSHSVHSEIGR